MAITFRPVTAPDDDELMLLHELNPGYTVERLADGALLVSPNGAAGGMRNANLALQLGLWERRARCGPIFDSSTGFRLADTSVFAPDGAFVRMERWEPLPPASAARAVLRRRAGRGVRDRLADGSP